MRKTQLAAIACSMLVLAMAFAPVVVLDEDDESEALGVVGWYTIGVFGVGFAAGLALASLLSSPEKENNATEISELNKALARSEAQKISLASSTLVSMASSIMPTDTDMIHFTQNYWDQAMEYQVYAEWSKENIGKYDESCKNMLSGTGYLTAESKYLSAWANALGGGLSNVLEQTTKLTSDVGKYVDSIEVSFSWDGKKIAAENGSDKGKLGFSLAQAITPSKDTLVYIDVLEGEDNYKWERSGTIYLYGTNGSKTIQNVDTGKQYTLSKGSNDVSSLPEGVYSLPAGASYAGPMISTIGEDTDHVSGVAVLRSETAFYVVSALSEAQYRIVSSDGESWTTNTLTLDVDDGTNNYPTNLLSPKNNLVNFWNKMVDSFNTIADNVYDTGLATWTIFDTVEESSPYIHPSSLPVNDVDGTTSMVEKINLTINMMAQIKDYYTAHEGDLKDLDFKYNKESLNLYCYGNLYLDGRLWAENVIFTPRIYTADQHLEIGMNTWSGSGSMTIWAQADSFSDWDGSLAVSSPVVPLSANYQLEIKKIVSNGSDVQSIDLKRATIHINGGEEIVVPDPVPTPAVYDASILWMVIIVEAGLILILLGRITGITVLSLAGVVVLLVGIIIPQAVSSLILGTFTWSDLKPFGWL